MFISFNNFVFTLNSECYAWACTVPVCTLYTFTATSNIKPKIALLQCPWLTMTDGRNMQSLSVFLSGEKREKKIAPGTITGRFCSPVTQLRWAELRLMACARIKRRGGECWRPPRWKRARENAAGKGTCTYFSGVHCHWMRPEDELSYFISDLGLVGEA